MWYNKVVKDITHLPECIDYFNNELDEGRKELSMKNKTIEKHGADLPGIVERRYSQLQEIEAILEHLNIQLREKRSHTFKRFLESYNKSLSSRDAEKYVDGDKDVVDLTILVNEFALIRNKFLALHKGLDQKGWMIGHIVKLRTSGLDDAAVD